MCSFNVFTLRLFTALCFKSNPPRSTAVKDTQGKFAYERNRTSSCATTPCGRTHRQARKLHHHNVHVCRVVLCVCVFACA